MLRSKIVKTPTFVWGFLFHIFIVMESQGSFIEQKHHKGLSKLLSSDAIMKNFPMIDRVDAYVLDDVGMVYFRVFLNDDTITQKNMYEKGYDPHYLVDKYFYQLMKYFDIPQNFRYQIITVLPTGENIHNYTHL